MANRLRTWLAERAGFYREAPDYIRALKKTAIQEIVFGESAIAIAFTVYTFVYTISLMAVLMFFAASFALAGYHIWRPYHLRLQPKLQFEQKIFPQLNKAITINTSTLRWINYIQLLPRCATDSPVEDSRGRLLRVLRMGEHGWEPTELNEPLDLVWSNHDSLPRTLEPDVDQRLNLLSVSVNSAHLEVAHEPLKTADVLKVNQAFLFQVKVTGKDCPPININVRVQFQARGPAEITDDLPTPVEVAIVTHLF